MDMGVEEKNYKREQPNANKCRLNIKKKCMYTYYYKCIFLKRRFSRLFFPVYTYKQ